MDKKKLADRLIEQNDGSPIVTPTKLHKMLGVSYPRVASLVEGLIPISKNGKRGRYSQFYLIDEIVDELMEKGL